MARRQNKKLRFKLKLGTGVDWEALGPIPEPFPFCVDADCTTLCFKHFLSLQILDGVFDPSSLRLRLEGSDRELEETADADGPTTSTYQPKLLRLAEQGVCDGSVVQLDVCAPEEEMQRYLEEAEARAVANDLAGLEADASAKTAAARERLEAGAAGDRQPQAATTETAVGPAVEGGEGPEGLPSLGGVMHTPAGTVGTYLDDDDDDDEERDEGDMAAAAAYLQEDRQAAGPHEVPQGEQQAQQQPHHLARQGGQARQQQWQSGEGQEELGGLNVAPEGEPREAQEGEEEEPEQQQEQVRGQRHDAAAVGTAAASGQWLRRRQLNFDKEEVGYQDVAEDGEDSGLGLRQPAAQPSRRPPMQAASTMRQQQQQKQQEQQRPRPSGEREREAVGKRPRGAQDAEGVDLVSDSDDQGAEPARQQQRVSGGAAAASASRGATRPPARSSAGAAGPSPAHLQPQPPPHPAPARSVGLPPYMQLAVDTGPYIGYHEGGVGSPAKERVSSSFWSLEEIVRLVNYVESHGARRWSDFLAKDPMRRTVEQVKMRWRNLEGASRKGWQEMRRVHLPADLRQRIDLIIRKTG